MRLVRALSFRAPRVRQGLILVVGAIALDLLVTPGRLHFYWTPLVAGLVYLAAAASGGRRGSYWATATVLCGWGTAVVIVVANRPADIDHAGAYLFGAGIGAVAGSLLERAGFAVNQLGLGANVAAAGLLLALSPKAPDVLDHTPTCALAIGLVGVLNLVLAVLGERGARTV